MMDPRRALLAVIAAASISGCATTGLGTGWDAAPATTWIERGGQYSVLIPPDWFYQYDRSRDRGNTLVATREGPLLQRIVVTHRRNDRAFPGTDKQASPDMLPQELAERFVAETTSNFELDVVDVIRNEPARLGGIDGFRLHLQFRAGELRYQMLASGVSTNAGFFTLSYVAPVLHYFDRDKDVFERSANSFRLLGGSD